MNFTNITNENEESIRAASVIPQGSGCKCKFTYPIKYSDVCAFEIPIFESFSEQSAAEGKYKMHMLKYPKTEQCAERPCNFALFPVNGNGELVRGKNPMTFCTVTVEYEFTDVKKVITPARLFRKEVSETKRYIDILANVDIFGREILYTTNACEGVFCIPSDLKGGVKLRLEGTGDEQLFSDKQHISIIKRGGI